MPDTVEAPERSFFGHPRGLANLFGIEVWERFSFYGMQAILVYYLYFAVADGGLGLPEASATSIVGAYGGLVYLSTVFGAWIADRVAGSERTLFSSAVLIMLGHLGLAVLPGLLGVTAGLVLVGLGSGGLKANATSLLGSLYEPVEGERFDRIVSNPPFVITPRAPGVPEYEYRDGGLEGDAIVEAVIRDAARHLTPGGMAQLLGNWEYRGSGGDALERVRDWAGALEHWIVEREVQRVTEYAETWIRDGGTRPGTAEFDRLYEAWLDDFERRGVREIGFGYVLLRRAASSSARPLERIERRHGSLGESLGGLGAHVAHCLDAHDVQAAWTDGELAGARLRVAGDVTEERHYWPGDDDPTAMVLRQGGGFGRIVELDTGLAALVGACDGELSVGSIVAALAELLDVDERALADDLLPAVRALVDDGMLLVEE